MKKSNPPKFDQDWTKAVLLVFLLAQGLPDWAQGQHEWKVLAAFTGWPKKRCLAAFREAQLKGMLAGGEADPTARPDSFAA